ncbi:hypothetical protein L7F22_038780 [Adiantum nelumboides]|nr:hypothetical protein [Adiantum nelumboides]
MQRENYADMIHSLFGSDDDVNMNVGDDVEPMRIVSNVIFGGIETHVPSASMLGFSDQSLNQFESDDNDSMSDFDDDVVTQAMTKLAETSKRKKSKRKEHEQKNALLASPYFSILVDETTDKSLEKHLIVYITFLAQAGLGSCKNGFLKLEMVTDGCAQTKYDALVKIINDMGLDMKRRLVGIATDGDSSMLGCHDRLVAKLTQNVPHLISVHCVAHREALAVSDACKCIFYLSYVDTIANRVYSWISGSSVRHKDFQKLLHEMNIEVLEVLQIHNVKWLARGNVMQRLT